MWGISSWDIYPNMQCCCVFLLICIWRTTECHLLHNVTDVCVLKYFLANTTSVLDSTAFQIILKYKSSIWFWPEQLCMLHIRTWEISCHLTKHLLPIIHQCMGRRLVGVLSSAGLFALVCALGAGKHGHPELWEMCVRGRDLGEVVSAHCNCLAHIFPCHLSPWHVSQMTMAFFIFSSF